MAYYLVAANDLAKSFLGPEGPDLAVRDGTQLGRGVVGEGAYRFPSDWVQFSGTHCRLYFSEAENSWMIEDTSTNGTYVNDTRIKKSSALTLKDGDCIMLSQPPKDVVKYIFTKTENISPESKTFSAAQAKKRQMQNYPGADSRATDVSNKRVKPMSPANPPVPLDIASEGSTTLLKALSQIRASNQDLRKQNEDLRLRNSDLEKNLKAAEAALIENDAAWKSRGKEMQPGEVAALEEKIKDLQGLLVSEQLAHQNAVQEAARAQVEKEGFLSRESHLRSDIEVLNAEKETTKQLLSKSRKEASELRMEVRQAVARSEALIEELNAAQMKLAIESAAVIAERKRVVEAEEWTAAARASCEETQRRLLAAKEEIEEMKGEMEAGRAKERGMKDCIAVQHALMEGLRVALNHALEMQNESHLKLLEVQSRMTAAFGEYEEHVKEFEMTQMVRDPVSLGGNLQAAIQSCGAAGAGEGVNVDATMILSDAGEPCPSEVTKDHNTEGDLMHMKPKAPAILTVQESQDCTHPHLQAHHSADRQAAPERQMHKTPGSDAPGPSRHPTLPVRDNVTDDVAASGREDSQVGEQQATEDDLNDPSLDEHITLTLGSRRLMDDDDSSAMDADKSSPDSEHNDTLPNASSTP
eukprot:evm.model.scf_1138.5 EVM.evm.TU.scf_1138.5   scf_1138:32539-39395(-)